jgi:hypothetical protein
MLNRYRAAAALPAVWLAACSNSANHPAAAKTSEAPIPPARITQFYATVPKLSAGEKSLLCYGVENARNVWLSPPRQELSAALARCVEVTPGATTTYTLTAEGNTGPAATQNLTITVGAARAHIEDVTVSSLSVKAGDAVSICFHARHAAAVSIAPLHFRAPNPAEGCAMDNPRKTTTYVVSATGANGDRDTQPVTVKVQ